MFQERKNLDFNIPSIVLPFVRLYCLFYIAFFLLWTLFIRTFDYPNNTYIILCIFPNQVIVLDLSFFVGHVSDELICERKYDPRVVANTEEKISSFLK